MSVETAPIVPGEKDGRATPIGTLHKSIDQACYICLPNADQGRWMFAVLPIRHNPGNCRQGTVFRGGKKLPERLDIAKLAVLPDRIEVGQRIPTFTCSRLVRLWPARHRVVFP